MDVASLLTGFGVGAVVFLFVGRAIGARMASARTAVLEAEAARVAGLEAERTGLIATLSDAKATAAAAVARADEAAKAHAAERERAGEAFAELAAKVLERNARGVADLAGAAMERERREITAGLATARQADAADTETMRHLMNDLAERLERVERGRHGDAERIETRIAALTDIGERMTAASAKVAAGLTGSIGIRGTWGEIQLARILEHAGIAKHVLWTAQETIAGAQGDLRPDVVILLPDGKRIPIDAKAPVADLIAAAATEDVRERARRVAEHTKRVAAHVRILASKSYHAAVGAPVALTICFLPSEAALAAALTEDHGLLEDAIGRGVILAGPSTLVALVHAMAHVWSTHEAAVNADAIHDLAVELIERVSTFSEHVRGTGAALAQAVASHNAGCASFRSRIAPTARRIADLGVSGGAILIPEPIEDPVSAGPEPIKPT